MIFVNYIIDVESAYAQNDIQGLASPLL